MTTIGERSAAFANLDDDRHGLKVFLSRIARLTGRPAR
jgi:hypothetical protein